MFFKVYIKQVKDGKFMGEAALTGDYRNLKTAINAGKENLLTDESTFCVRKYDDTVAVNIMSNNINDTGNLVYVCKNYLEVARDKDNTNKAQEDRKPVHVVLDELGYSIYYFSVEQMEQILLGDAHGIDYTLYAKPQYDAKKMAQVRQGLEEAAKEDIGKVQEETVRNQLKAMRTAIGMGEITMTAVVSAIIDTFVNTKQNEVMKTAFIEALPYRFKCDVKNELTKDDVRYDVKIYTKDHHLPYMDELANNVAERWIEENFSGCDPDYWNYIGTLVYEESEKLGLSKETEDIELD